MLKIVEEYTLKLCTALGYDFNTVEFAVRDGIPYAIDFCNPAPDADIHSVGQANFDWVVKTSADYAIERAKDQKKGMDNLTWGTYIRNSAAGIALDSDQDISTKLSAKKTAKKAPGKELTV